MLNVRSRLIPRELEPGYYRGGPFSTSSVSFPSHFNLERELEGLVFPRRRIQPPKRLALNDAPVPPLSLPAGSSNDFVDLPVPTTPPRSPRAEEKINTDSGLKKKLLKLCKQDDITTYWSMKNTTMMNKLKGIGINPYK